MLKKPKTGAMNLRALGKKVWDEDQRQILCRPATQQIRNELMGFNLVQPNKATSSISSSHRYQRD